jgi:hypothetical protein
MKINLAMWDRLIRTILGILLTAWAVAGGPWWAWIGIYLILSAAWGLCLVYSYFKIQTAEIKSRSQDPNSQSATQTTNNRRKN